MSGRDVQCSGHCHTRRDGIVSRSGFDSDTPTARATPHATRVSKPDAVSHVYSTALQPSSSDCAKGGGVWLLHHPSKNATRRNPTTPSGPVQDPVNQFQHTSRRSLFWLACQSAKRLLECCPCAVAAWRRQPWCDSPVRRDTAGAVVVSVRAGQPTNQISLARGSCRRAAEPGKPAAQISPP